MVVLIQHHLYFIISAFVSVKGTLNLKEGSPCITEGINGTCRDIWKCPTAAHTYIYVNGGYSPKKFPELPAICSKKNNTIIVCCTDCDTLDDSYRHATVGPNGNIIKKTGRPAHDRCADYFQYLPYPCRGKGNVEFKKYWDEKRKCHKSGIMLALPVGGRDAQIWEFPHVALLGYGKSVDSAQWLCGGSVISEWFILTAAHCTSAVLIGSIKYAALGLLKRTDPKNLWKIYNIKRIVIHPEYRSPTKYHDVALLETDTEINFGRGLLPACLDVGDTHKVHAEAAGWGQLGHKQALADNLQVVYLDEYNKSDCSALYRPHRHLKQGYDHEKQMCYGSRTEIIDTCQGDSGGPLQTNFEKCQYIVVGVTSYGRDCGVLGNAGVYTRVAHYVPWIESIVWP